MPELIADGRTGDTAHIDQNNQVHGFVISETERESANRSGNEYNLNSGIIALTGSSESAVIYFANEESPVNGETGYFVTDIAYWMGIRTATVTDYGFLRIYKNISGGDIISDATAVDMKSNSNFGSNSTLNTNTKVYKGKDGGTQSGGSLHALLGIAEGRGSAPINMSVPKGSNLAVTIDLNTSGGADVYVALIGYRVDGLNK